jgi:hypothetical protein
MSFERRAHSRFSTWDAGLMKSVESASRNVNTKRAAETFTTLHFRRMLPSNLNPSLDSTPYTLHPTSYTLHPTPCTLHPKS